jgi:hypothetical protein
MMEVNGMDQLYHALLARGLDAATARRYAVLIGDTPEVNGSGHWVVRDEGGIVLDTIEPVMEE